MTARTALPASAFGPDAARVAAREREAAAAETPVLDARVDFSAFRRKPSSAWRG